MSNYNKEIFKSKLNSSKIVEELSSISLDTLNFKQIFEISSEDMKKVKIMNDLLKHSEDK